LVTDLTGHDAAVLVAQRLLDVIGQPVEINRMPLVLTASIGIAMMPADAAELPELVRCAEQAVYVAKAAGGARYRFYDEQMNVQAASRVRLELELRHALADGELLLHFQPKFDLACGAIVGAEALVRWQHPVNGIISPGGFIPLAEEIGLILPLTDWVLEESCRSLRAWADAGLPQLPLSVNLPAASLAGPALVEQLDALMHRFRLAPRSLTLEVTESMLMRNIDTATSVLAALRARGYGLSLDDFGTGYSSLSYLKHLPIHELKIDRSFVMDANRNDRDAALVSAIITLGRELGLRVVAEGVEMREQAAFLLQRGCSLQQGYLHCRPVPAAGYERLLKDQALTPALAQ
jgi:EAL domain-containing protein (putative c-di-GMP-specific phosphodiesterase class I)